MSTGTFFPVSSPLPQNQTYAHSVGSPISISWRTTMKQSQLIISTGKWYETIGDSLVLITERVDENDIAYIDGARFRDLGGGTYDENGHAIAAWVTDSLS